MRDYLASRPVVAELEAIERAIAIARETGCSLHVVHVSTGSGVRLVGAAREEGVDVTCETCPHYLALDDEDAVALGMVAKCSPPLRPRAELDDLWETLLEGLVDLVASDHSPSPPELKLGDDAFAAWGGIAGCQTLLRVLLTEGPPRGLSLETIASLCAEAPARRFGLAGKGSLARRRRRRSRAGRPVRRGGADGRGAPLAPPPQPVHRTPAARTCCHERSSEARLYVSGALWSPHREDDSFVPFPDERWRRGRRSQGPARGPAAKGETCHAHEYQAPRPGGAPWLWPCSAPSPSRPSSWRAEPPPSPTPSRSRPPGSTSARRRTAAGRRPTTTAGSTSRRCSARR